MKLCKVKEAKHKWPHLLQLHLYEILRRDKSIEIENKLMVARSCEKVGLRNDCLMGMKFLFVTFYENVLELYSDDFTAL